MVAVSKAIDLDGWYWVASATPKVLETTLELHIPSLMRQSLLYSFGDGFSSAARSNIEKATFRICTSSEPSVMR